MEIFLFLGALVHLLWPLVVIVIGGAIGGAIMLYYFITDIPFQVRGFFERRRIMKMDDEARARKVEREWKVMTPREQHFFTVRGICPDTNYGMPEGFKVGTDPFDIYLASLKRDKDGKPIFRY